MTVYTTSLGDTFDIIAKKFYNDETQVLPIIEENKEYANVILFSEGTNLIVPEIIEEEIANIDIPDWRK